MASASEKDLRFLFTTSFRGGSVHILCPEHDDTDESLAVYPDHGYCFGCGKYYGPAELANISGKSLDSLPLVSSSQLRGEEVTSPVLVSSWHRLLIDSSSPLHHRLEWLRKRGLRLSTIVKHKLGHDGRCFTIPLYSESGELLGVKRRRDDVYNDPDFPKYLAPKGMKQAIFRPNPKGNVTIITEGELDALLLSQYDVDAITTNSGAESLVSVVAPLRMPFKVYAAVDNDEAGDRAFKALDEALEGRLRRCKFGEKDVTDALMNLSESERVREIRKWLE